MNLQSAEIANTVATGAHVALVSDGAGRHGSGKPIVPDTVSPVEPLRYVPEHEPIEDVWPIYAARRWLVACSTATTTS